MNSESTIESKLEQARRDLINLTARNRLINTPRSKYRSGRLEIVDELSEEVFRILVKNKKPMSFFPIPEEEDQNEDETDDQFLPILAVQFLSTPFFELNWGEIRNKFKTRMSKKTQINGVLDI